MRRPAFFLFSSLMIAVTAHAGEFDAGKALQEETVSLLDIYIGVSAQYHRDLGGREMDTRKLSRKIETMVADIRGRLGEDPPPEMVTKIFRRVVFTKGGFRVSREGLFSLQPDEVLLDSLLKDKKGSCLSLSLLYLILARELDIPMSGVMAPGHLFVRYDDGSNTAHIETTRSGEVLSEKYYRDHYTIPAKPNVYLRDLNDAEVAAVLLSNFGNVYKMSGRYERAVSFFDAALQVIPDFPPFLTNRGNVFERRGDIAGALAEYRKALAVDPEFCEAHYNTALAHYLYTKDEDMAVFHGIKAARLGCRMHPRFRRFLREAVKKREVQE